MNFISQKNQDEWVIKDVFNYKKNGFYVDLAAADGKAINNTYLLEKKLNWTGICIEPHPFYIGSLRRNRKCTVINKCVDYKVHEIEFRIDNGFGSGVIDDDTDNNEKLRGDAIQKARNTDGVRIMETITLERVLRDCGAPRIIDYLSFDVEGCETRIMKNFPFDKFTFLSMTIERPTVLLNQILFANGYVFVRNSDSMSKKYGYDSFYVHESIVNLSEIEKMDFSQIPAKDW